MTHNASNEAPTVIGAPARILVLSAYDAESHKLWRANLSDVLPNAEITHLVLPARHFAWRIRGNPLSWYQCPELNENTYDACIATSMVDVASLRGFGFPAMACPVVVYFHENQFAYPASGNQKFSDDPKVVQLYSALAADVVCFNSQYNRDSFLLGAEKWMRRMPDHVQPEAIVSKIKAKAQVLPVPLKLSDEVDNTSNKNATRINVVWNHRWEYDKGPHRLLAFLQHLPEHLPLEFHIVGQSFRKIPEEMEHVKSLLEERGWMGAWGYQQDIQEYQHILQSSDFVLSTSEHDFQGLAIIEAVAAGCIPILPHRLVYPEFFNQAYLYPSHQDVDAEAQALVEFAQPLFEKKIGDSNTDQAPSMKHFSTGALSEQYQQLLSALLSKTQ